jgi:tyrosyl-tRNA synthetase
MGGADQYGNITAGLELIRRQAALGEGQASGSDAFALAYPLLLAPSGSKFGKSEAGDSVWLHPDGTSPYAFYQHWLNTDDRDVPVYLRWFTTLAPDEIAALEAELAAHPEARAAQRALALDITSRVHGRDAASAAVRASEAGFSGKALDDPAVLATLHAGADGFDFRTADTEAGLVGLLVASGTSTSRGEARRLIEGGGLTVNDSRVTDAAGAVPPLIAGEWLVVRVGKRRLRVGRRVG